MPIYMDRHYNIEGATRHAIALAHEKDLKIQEKYGVQFLTYWFDEKRGTTFCLVDAPNKERIRKAHDEAHGDIPHEIIEVDPTVVEAFLGRVKDPAPKETAGTSSSAAVDSAFRAIMFTDLKDSTAMTTQLGDAKAIHLLHIHNSLIRTALRDYDGREVKHTGDGIMASFTSIPQAIECTIAIQKAFANYNKQNKETPMHLRIGLSAGEPVEEDNDLFGSTVQLASRICNYADPGQILAAEVIFNQYPGEKSLFTDLGRIALKGFDYPVQVYEVRWQG
ncbi:MAG TPA: nickel-binding protein [Thermodesulfobacteriota bacterium]|nr:nickel-binding protein [Thermodesulfobacteriota bacterium]